MLLNQMPKKSLITIIGALIDALHQEQEDRQPQLYAGVDEHGVEVPFTSTEKAVARRFYTTAIFAEDGKGNVCLRVANTTYQPRKPRTKKEQEIDDPAMVRTGEQERKIGGRK